MGTITFVRHGQANSAAKTEEDYDRLSPKGHEQAAILGNWMRDQGHSFDLVLSGSLRRHRETAVGMGYDTPEIDDRLNEVDYFNLGKAMEDVHGMPIPDGDDFARHIPLVMEAWHRAEIMGNETFEAFETRISTVLDAALTPGRNVLCITSGGVIAMIVRRLLDLDPRRMAHVMIPIFNTSLHHVHVSPVGPILAGFNTIPHLESSDREHLRTHF